MAAESNWNIARRGFLIGAAGIATTAALEGVAFAGEPAGSRLELVGSWPAGATRMWLGPEFWANRFQDWQLNKGRIECIAQPKQGVLRTVGVLTREIRGDRVAQLRVRTGTLAPAAGFSGFLIGAGAGALDYRAAALVQGVSGTAGGLLCVYESDGRVRFREHTDELNQFAYAQLAVGTAGPARSLAEDVELRLDIAPADSGSVRLTLTAYDTGTSTVLSTATLDSVDTAKVRGGIALASSEDHSAPGARFWFQSLQVAGPGITEHPDRGLGPIVGTLFTVSGSVLKMTVQLVPGAATTPQEVRLEIRSAGGGWRQAGSAPVQDGYAALLRVNGWDGTRDWEYRVICPSSPHAVYQGRVPAEPAGRPLVIGTINCVKATHRSLNQASNPGPKLPGEHELGLYTDRNIYFPYAGLTSHLAAQRPDLLVALGDQFYETSPTSKDTSPSPTLDYFYKYLQWLWAFRDLTREIPTVVMVDDHDVFQGNIWGHSGAAAPAGDFNQGGYANSPDWVNMVQNVQCGHNPDPYDPTPVQQGISVYYCAFAYGGVSFAVLEDRKFKNTDADNLDQAGNPLPPNTLELLGPRQEAFLGAWKSMHPGLPKVCLTQTTLACFQTDEQGMPRRDFDSNGYPETGRLRALQLLKDAGAVILSGDQHLGALVRHGLTDFTDGPVQFASPAGSSSFQRWFEPADSLPNGSGQPYTGDFTDGFGNKLRVLAVANPKVTFADYRTGYPTGQGLGDQSLKREGYGIVRVDARAAEFVVECWPWQIDPTKPQARQFSGWPLSIAFSEV
ncbi:alkaline phosphatase D family protein [Streptomyces sp. NPDC005917]|uniref:alkaline phosphatase D family protein n=1 Tax=unclassified Streptomyces TaxID=2593676 RepID=UPI003411192F